ncbi:MAG TPA: hypothetical protein ENN21_05980, partial [Spirochaetes bacterium]|nr:hypothetical protein [Spirochaetota bacterium]
MKESTKEFFRMFNGISAADTMMDGYIYLRWISRFMCRLRESTGEKPAAPPDDGGEAVDELIQASARKLMPRLMSRETSPYHGKILTLKDAAKLVSVDRDLSLPSLPETIIPYRIA